MKPTIYNDNYEGVANSNDDLHDMHLRYITKINPNKKYTFNEERWIVSLITEKSSATIIIEGVSKESGWRNNKKANPTGKDLFIAEYYVISEDSALLTNIKFPDSALVSENKLAVSYNECAEYNPELLELFSTLTVRSWRISRERAMDMINAIKKEQSTYDKQFNNNGDRLTEPYRFFSNDGKQTCELWCCDVLATAKIKIEKPMSWFSWYNWFSWFTGPVVRGTHQASDSEIETNNGAAPEIVHPNTPKIN